MNENEKELNEKLYTQKELEDILSHRLSRERKNTESLQYIRDALAEFRKQEPYKSLSNARIAQLVVDMAKKALDNTALDTAEKDQPSSAVPTEKTNSESAEYNGTQSPENTQNAETTQERDGTRDDVGSYNTPPMPEPTHDGQNAKIGEIAEFLARFGEQSLNEAINDRAFKAFCAGKSGRLCELYTAYKDFIAALSLSPEVKKYRELKNGFASTGFSGNSSPVIDYGSILTENQRQIAAASGISYKQYAELLAQIPTKKLNYKN